MLFEKTLTRTWFHKVVWYLPEKRKTENTKNGGEQPN